MLYQSSMFQEFVKIAVDVEEFNYAHMFLTLKRLETDHDKISIINDFFFKVKNNNDYRFGRNLIADRMYAEMLAYYIYCQRFVETQAAELAKPVVIDGRMLQSKRKPGQQDSNPPPMLYREFLKITLERFSQAVGAPKTASKIVKNYLLCRTLYTRWITTNLLMTTTMHLAVPAYFGMINLLAEANHQPASAVIAKQLMVHHLWLHLLLTVPAGVTTLINDVSELVAIFYERWGLAQKIKWLSQCSDRNIYKTLLPEYKKQLKHTHYKIALLLSSTLLSLPAIIQPLVSSAKLFGIGAPWVMVIALGIRLVRHLGSACYYLSRYFALKKQAKAYRQAAEKGIGHYNEEKAEQLEAEADRYLNRMQQSLIQAAMSGIAMGLMIAALLFPNPAMVVVFAAFMVIGLILLFGIAARRIHHQVSEQTWKQNYTPKQIPIERGVAPANDQENDDRALKVAEEAHEKNTTDDEVARKIGNNANDARRTTEPNANYAFLNKQYDFSHHLSSRPELKEDADDDRDRGSLLAE